MSKGLEIINSKLKVSNNKFDRQVVNCIGETLFLIKKEELNIIEKELKALEIIIEKRVQIHTFVIDNPTWEEVEEDWDYWFSKRPTREEYDLLKEVLL